MQRCYDDSTAFYSNSTQKGMVEKFKDDQAGAQIAIDPNGSISLGTAGSLNIATQSDITFTGWDNSTKTVHIDPDQLLEQLKVKTPLTKKRSK